MNPYNVIKRGVITEKASLLQSNANLYTIAVDPKATKAEIKNAVQQLFDVKVESVRTVQCSGKVKRVGYSVGKRPDWKKAYVTLKKGEKLELIKE